MGKEERTALELIKEYPRLQRRKEELEAFLAELDKFSSVKVATYETTGRKGTHSDPVAERVINIEAKGWKAQEELIDINITIKSLQKLREHFRAIAAEGSSRGKEYLHLFDLLLSGWNGRGKPPGLQMSAGTCRARLKELCQKALYVSGISPCKEE